MKDIKTYILEQLESEEKTNQVTEGNESIKNADEFREYAKQKFEEAFGEDNDEEKMNQIIESIIEEQGEDDDWGKAIGKLNESFAK